MENVGFDAPAKKTFSSGPWLFIIAIWTVMIAAGITLALALGIWSIWQAF